MFPSRINLRKMSIAWVFFFVVVFSCLLLFGCSRYDKPSTYDVLLDYLEKQKNITEYHIEFAEESEGMVFDVVGYRKGDDYNIKIESVLDTRWMIKKNGNEYLCVNIKGTQDTYCSDVTNNTLYSNEIKKGVEKLVTDEGVEKMEELIKVLHNASALEFDENITVQSIGGMQCSQITFHPDYKKLTLMELLKIGVDPNSPLVVSVTNFTETLCLEKETGMPLKIDIRYTNKGKPTVLTRDVSLFKLAVPQEAFDLPSDIDNTTRFQNTYAKAKALLRKYYECTNSNNSDYCFKQVAFLTENYRFCNFIVEPLRQDQCFVLSTIYASDPGQCMFVNDPYNKDVCYYELVNNWGNKSLCELIVNTSLKEDCYALNVTVKEKTIECVEDTECHITGYYNQTCAPVNYSSSEEVAWNDIFSCYTEDKTSCICINNKCSWDLTKEVMDCIDKFEIQDFINSIGNESNNATEEE